jgi:hypothetical protein
VKTVHIQAEATPRIAKLVGEEKNLENAPTFVSLRLTISKRKADNMNYPTMKILLMLSMFFAPLAVVLGQPLQQHQLLGNVTLGGIMGSRMLTSTIASSRLTAPITI